MHIKFSLTAAFLLAASLPAFPQALPGAVQSVTVDCHAGCTNLVFNSGNGWSTSTAGNTLVLRFAGTTPITVAPTDAASNPWYVCTGINSSSAGCYAASNGTNYAYMDMVFYAGAASSVSLGSYTYYGAVELDEIPASTATMVDQNASTVVTSGAATTGLSASLTSLGTNDIYLCAIAYPATPTLSGSLTTVNYNDSAAGALFASGTEATAGTYSCAATWASTAGSPAVSMVALALNGDTPVLFTPILSPVTGKYGPTQTVTMSSVGRTYPSSQSGGSNGTQQNLTSYAPQASLYYTITAGTTGTTPTCSSTLYNPSSPPTVSVTSTVEVIACATGMTSSPVAKSVITITGVLTPTTYYVLAGGGTQAQCTGKSNAIYPGSGSAQACAWGDFRWAYTNGTSGNNAWVMQGGDTLKVDAATQWRVGFNSGASYSDSTYCPGLTNGTCYPPPIPNGTSSQPTQILGSNYASCDSPVSSGTYGPVGPYNGNAMNATQLHGGYGLGTVLTLAGSSYVNLECLEITSYNGVCSRSGGAPYPRGCNTTPPIDDYATTGITTTAGTHDILFQDMWVHNAASYGLFGPFGVNMDFTRVLVAFNVFAGWDMDDGIGSNNSQPNPTGAGLIQNYLSFYGNGCNEAYPTFAGYPANSCYDDNDGGFGDSWSGQGSNLTTFYCNHCFVAYNTKDGDIGPHDLVLNRTTLNSVWVGNMGQQQKFGVQPGATVIFENNQVTTNCQRMSQTVPGALQNFAAVLITAVSQSGSTFTFTTVSNSQVVDGATVGLIFSPSSGAASLNGKSSTVLSGSSSTSFQLSISGVTGVTTATGHAEVNGGALTDFCRAGGDGIAVKPSYNGTLLFANNSIAGYAATTFDFSLCFPNDTCGNTSIKFENNPFTGYSEATYNSGQQPGLFYGGSGGSGTDPSISLTYNHNDYYNNKTATFPTGDGTSVYTSPLFTSQPATPITAESQLDNFNYSLSSTSPAIHAGTPISGLTTDFAGNAWNNPPSMGSLEYQTGTTYALTVTIVGSGSFTGTNCVTGNYASGTSIGTCTATASTGYTFTSITNTCGFTASSNTISGSMPASSCGITVTFTVNTYTLTCNTNPSSGEGTISCSASGSVAYGTSVTATATQAAGYLFTGFSGGTITGLTNPQTFLMPASNSTATANFQAPGQSLVMSGMGSGTGGP